MVDHLLCQKTLRIWKASFVSLN